MPYFLRVVGLFPQLMLTIVLLSQQRKSSLLSQLYQKADYEAIVKAKRKRIPGDC